MAVTRKQYFPLTVTIDGQPVRLTLARMDVPQFEQFRAAFVSFASGRGAPVTLGQKIDDHVTVDQIRAEGEYLRANAEWQQDVCEAYVRVHEGDVFDEAADGTTVAITSGRQFANMFHGQNVIQEILAQLFLFNCLTEDQKKKLPSRSDFAPGLNAAPLAAVPGTPPATAAESVEREASADPGDAMAPSSARSSGTVDRSSFEPVQSAI